MTWERGRARIEDLLASAELERTAPNENHAIERLVGVTFVEEVGPWNPDMSEFTATWPEALRNLAIRHAASDVVA